MYFTDLGFDQVGDDALNSRGSVRRDVDGDSTKMLTEFKEPRVIAVRGKHIIFGSGLDSSLNSISLTGEGKVLIHGGPANIDGTLKSPQIIDGLNLNSAIDEQKS